MSSVVAVRLFTSRYAIVPWLCIATLFLSNASYLEAMNDPAKRALHRDQSAHTTPLAFLMLCVRANSGEGYLSRISHDIRLDDDVHLKKSQESVHHRAVDVTCVRRSEISKAFALGHSNDAIQ